ncbi:lactate racemase domain-containing protein [Caldithrix abyssi]
MMRTIHIPWAAWFDESRLELELPPDSIIDFYSLSDAPPLSEEHFRLKTKDLCKLVKKKNPTNILIVVDDLTRPVILEPLLKTLVDELHSCGFKTDQIKFLIGLGAHHPLSKESAAKKLGRQIVENYRWINHDPQETEPTGLQWGKTEFRLNKHYLQADFRVVISGLTPHSFAGFSGGAKMLIPGISDLGIITKTHKSVLMGFMGKLGEVEKNRFRHVIEEMVAQVGIDFFIGVVINGNRTIADIFCGDFKEAHRQAALKARQLYTTEAMSNAPYDLLILNAYPKDTELLQAENAFIPLKSADGTLLKEEGMVLVTSACSEGLGYHGLFGPGGLLYRKPRPLRFLKGRQFLFYSPNITPEEFKTIFFEDYPFFSDEKALFNYLKKNLPERARVGVFPFASLQLVRP